jgi:hypothetical protein
MQAWQPGPCLEYLHSTFMHTASLVCAVLHHCCLSRTCSGSTTGCLLTSVKYACWCTSFLFSRTMGTQQVLGLCCTDLPPHCCTWGSSV